MEISLVKFEDSFLETSFRWRSQPSTIAHNAVVDISKEELLRSHQSEGVNLKQLGEFKKFRWFIRHENQIVGMVSLRDIDLNSFIAEIGYGIDENFQGRGLASRAVKQVVDMIFFETALRRITAHVCEKNLASIAVMKKVGFVQEGILREYHLINGQPENAVLFAVLKKDWLLPY